MDSANFQYLFYGLTVAWLILFGYVAALSLREGKLRKEVDNLKRLLDERERK